MEDILKKGAKVGKADEQIRQWKEMYEKSKIKVEPKTEVEKLIAESTDRINEIIQSGRKYPMDRSLNDYKNNENWRHEVWVEFLQAAKTEVRWSFGDVSVRKLVKQMEEIHNIKLEMPDFHLTPDMLYYCRQQGVFFVGDVAVAKSPALVERTKTQKYLKIVDWLRDQGMTVVQINFVVSEDMSNVHKLVESFERKGIIDPNREMMFKAKAWHETALNNMSRIMHNCESPQTLMKLLASTWSDIKEDRVDLPHVDYNMVEIKPIIEEDTIIEWVKEETEKRLSENYYDQNMDEALEAFEQLSSAKDPGKKIMQPKATLAQCENQYTYEQMTSHDLILDYVRDLGSEYENMHNRYLLDLLPDREQIVKMKECYLSTRKVKDIEKKVFGPFQYSRKTNSGNKLTMDLNHKLLKGKKIRNEKTKPDELDNQEYESFYKFIESNITKFGEVTKKPHFLSDDWEAANNFEIECTKQTEEIYRYCKSTVGAQMANTCSNLYQRIMHLKTSESMRDNVYVPPNSSYVCVMPKEHAPVSSSTCDMPAIFITRYPKEDEHKSTCEYEHRIETKNYVYFVSKLSRFNVSKIENWDQAGYRLVATCTYLLSNNNDLMKSKEKVVGTLTYLMLDIHQKTSEYLDLLKYISFMPFSQVHRLSKLVEDKMDLLKKTRLDVWILLKMKEFVVELSKMDKINAKKPIVNLFNAKITRESLGISMSLPSFIDTDIRHTEVQQFIEEVNTLFMVRPKHLYGSQFMDKSITSTVEWNVEYTNEMEKYGEWLTTGEWSSCCPKYPFDSKFAFCRDAILHAQNYMQENVPVNTNLIEKKLAKEKYTEYMFKSCTLRGCTKSKSRRKNRLDLHTTSMEECLHMYKQTGYKEKGSTILDVGIGFIASGEPMEFTMSEKDQRGSGRPIATPTLGAKAALALIEKPESALGKCVPNNIIVSGKSKLQEQSEAYKNLVSEAAIAGFKKVYQITEDQSKFSENDNTRKYHPYISNNIYLPKEVRKIQAKALDCLIGREHLVKRIPKKIMEDKELSKYLNAEKNGVKAIIGWPQGMLNFISTSVHSIADYWITYAYNKAYPNNKVMTKGLVHSDDSWVTVACNTEEDFIKFSVFRAVAKKLFCLKLNDKKLWGSKYLGELVSNYNINGNVHLSVTKTVTNAFSSLMFQNWVVDVNSQVSSIQQAYRNGADMQTLILMYTILKQQILNSYQVKGKQNKYLHLLPVELGGYPDQPVFSIAVSGLHSHYQQLLSIYMDPNNENEEYVRIVAKAMTLSILNNKGYKIDSSMRFYNTVEESKKYVRGLQGMVDETGMITGYVEEEELEEEIEVTQVEPPQFDNWADEVDYQAQVEDIKAKDKKVKIIKKVKRPLNDDDFENLAAVGRGDVFTCVKHIMPKSTKITKTITQLRDIPFIGSGLSMIITKPKSLKEALGDLKDQTSTMLYQLASEHYSQNTRRLAVSQAIQSSGKTVRIGEMKPMTMNEMLNFLLTCNIMPTDVTNFRSAFYDDSSMSEMCWNIVQSSEFDLIEPDKRKIINRMPEIESRYNTTSKLQDVLLKIVDIAMGTKYYESYTKQEATPESLREDVKNIKRRFSSYFTYYDVKYAVSLIMMEYLSYSKKKLWMQPYLRTESLEIFLCDLYGKTISREKNYKVNMIYTIGQKGNASSECVSTLYTAAVMDKIYPGDFKVTQIEGKDVEEILEAIDPISLTENDRLKLAMLKYHHSDDKHALSIADKQRQYKQSYQKEQKYVNGKYVGDFMCYVQYNATVIKIIGSPGKLKIVSSTSDTNEITKAMMEFTKRNFKQWNYEHPSQWAFCPLWQYDELVTSKLYLNYYSTSVTNITKSATTNSIPFELKRGMYFPVPVVYDEGGEYTTDNLLRKAYKTIDGRKYQAFSIRQEFSIPMADKCTFEHKVIDGFVNDELFKSKAIINICTGKYYNTPTAVYRKLLKERLNPIAPMSFTNAYRCLYSSIKKDDDVKIKEDIDMECEIVEIRPLTLDTAVGLMETTEPEDIEYVEANFICPEIEELHPTLKKANDIARFMAMIAYGSKTQKDIEDYITSLGKNRQFRKILWKHLSKPKKFKRDIEEWEEVILEMANIVPHELRAFIIGNSLDAMSAYKEVNVEQMLQRRHTLGTKPIVEDYANIYTNIVVTELEGRDDVYEKYDFSKIKEEDEESSDSDTSD